MSAVRRGETLVAGMSIARTRRAPEALPERALPAAEGLAQLVTFTGRGELVVADVVEIDGRRLPLQLFSVAGLLVDRTLLASLKGMLCILSESMIDRPGLGQDHEGGVLQLLLPKLVVLDGTTPHRIPRPLDVEVDEAGHAELLRLRPLEV